MSRYDVYGIGNAIVDTEFRVTDATIDACRLPKGVMTLVDDDRQRELVAELSKIEGAVNRSGGGSAANTMVAVAQFGGTAYYTCKLANDPTGDFFLHDLQTAGVDSNCDETRTEGISGECLSLITPDAERTLSTCLGVSANLSATEINEDALANSRYLYLEGYLVSGDDSRDLLKEIVADENFILANHSWGHLNMAHQGEEKVEKEIDRVNDLITEVGGTPTYFRFPFGSSNCGTAEAVRQRNMIITGWHIDSADWCFDVGGGTCPESTFRYVPDSMRDDMVGLVLQQVRARNGGVLLFHDVKSFTASSLPEVLEALRDEGYTFISLDDEEAFPLLHGQEPPPRPFVGDACTADEDCGFRNGQRWDGFCMNGQCAVGCEGYCPDMHGKAATFCVNDPDPEVAGGVCVPKAGPINSDCADSTRQEQDRYRGGSNAPAAQAAVCVPAEG